MASKRQREVVKMLEEQGLTLQGSVGHTGGGHLTVTAKAPNGATRKFNMAATPSEWRGDKNQIAMFRRFARENPADEKSVEQALTDLRTATTLKPETQAEYKVVKRLAPPPPSVPKPNVFTPPPAPPAPAAMTLSLLTPQTFQPPKEAEPIDLQSKSTPVQKENNMPAKKTTPAPAPTPSAAAPATEATKPTKHHKAAAGTRSTINRLDSFQIVDLADFLRHKYDWAALRPLTWDAVAEAATVHLEFKVTAANVVNLANHYKLALYVPPKMPDDPLSIIARHVKRLYDDLGHAVDEDFMKILQAQGQLNL